MFTSLFTYAQGYLLNKFKTERIILIRKAQASLRVAALPALFID
jgi:hypothetical protein